MMELIEGSIALPKARVAIVVARFNQFINDSLLSGAIDALTRLGQVNEKNITIVKVPGAYEIPVVAQRLGQSKKYDAIIVIGTVIRGSTAHFDFVAGECSSGVLHASLKTDTPIAFGVLTTDDIEQAIDRAGAKVGNKGAEAALTALEMISVLAQITHK